MKRQVLVIGIGAGSPDHLTVEAIDALNKADVIFIPSKGEEKRELAQTRRDIIARFAEGESRIVGFDNPVRDAANPSYRAGVDAWHAEVEDVYATLLETALEDGECGAFLAWGDPALYDSILRILERVQAKGRLDLDYAVIPGISSVQALAAAHKIPLNRIGESVLITTGRKLAERFPSEADTVVVMLDGQLAFKTVDPEVEIYWGAYLGTDDEILASGKLRDVAGKIEQLREEARAKKGWIMDVYLLRKPSAG